MYTETLGTVHITLSHWFTIVVHHLLSQRYSLVWLEFHHTIQASSATTNRNLVTNSCIRLVQYEETPTVKEVSSEIIIWKPRREPIESKVWSWPNRVHVRPSISMLWAAGLLVRTSVMLWKRSLAFEKGFNASNNRAFCNWRRRLTDLSVCLRFRN